jgi:ATP-dependent DNA ligase
LPTFVSKPPEGADWIHDVKFDGHRSHRIDVGGVRIVTRKGID